MSFEIAKCPMCDTRLVYPDAPKFDFRGDPARPRKVVIGIKCKKCPATTDIFVDTGDVCCFTPNQPLKVHVRGR